MDAPCHGEPAVLQRDCDHPGTVPARNRCDDGDQVRCLRQVHQQMRIVDFSTDFEPAGVDSGEAAEMAALGTAPAWDCYPVVFQLREGDLRAVGKRVVIAHHRTEMGPEKGVCDNVFVLDIRPECHSHVDLIPAEHVQLFGCRLVTDGKFDAWHFPEKGEHRRVDEPAERSGGSDVECADCGVAQVGDLLSADICVFDYLESKREHLEPRFGEDNLLGCPVEQLRAHLVFQLTDLLGNGPLGDVQFPGGFRETEAHRHFDKVFQLSQFHSVPVIGLFNRRY